MGSAIAHGTAVEACRRQRAQAGRRFEGLGQALIEGIVFDAGGQPLAGSFQDYAMRRADDFAALISPLRNESGDEIVLSSKTERGCRPCCLFRRRRQSPFGDRLVRS